MRYFANPLSALFAIGLTSASAAALPKIGDTEKETIEKFGAPQSKLDAGNYQVLNFDSYSVKVQQGSIVSVEPTTRQTPEQVQAKRLEIANRQYQRYANSEHVIRLSPQAQLDFWKRFQIKHPSIDVASELESAKTLWQNERSNLRLLAAQKAAEAAQIDRAPIATSHRSYTKRYVLARHSHYRHDHRQRDQEPMRKKHRPIKFTPERGLSAIAGVKPILSRTMSRGFVCKD